MSDKIQLIVGLGNPGREYESTRHNAGAWLVENLAQAHNATWQDEKKFFGRSTNITLSGQTIRLLVPSTFMNRSGQSVGAMAHFYKLTPDNILIAHDELDLPVGSIRLKKGGGHGGHNGLRDIITALGNQATFNRLRVGIGHPGQARLVVDYVLGKPTVDEYNQIQDGIAQAIAVLPDIAIGQTERAMQLLHTDSN